jgi:hypothetical protein
MKKLNLKRQGIAELLISLLTFAIVANSSLALFSQVTNGSFSGAVYAATGIPIVGATVFASGTNGSGYATTDPSGNYLINEGLPTGNYTVEVIATGYLMAENTSVHVTVGQTTASTNFYLTLSGAIKGKATDSVTTLPLQGVFVYAIPSGGGTFGWTAVTDSNGDYTIATNLNTGTYNVTAFNPTGYITEQVSGISVIAGAITSGVNLALDKSGILSGRITAYPGGSPLGNASVTAVSDNFLYYGSATTNATGYYSITSGLGTGTYTVYASYGFGGFNLTTGVSVTAGMETSNVDMFIITVAPPPSGIIMGRVTDIDTSDPIEGAFVEASGPGFGSAFTDANGDYVISDGLDTGTYDVTASATGYNSTIISGVSVTVNQTTPNVDFQLTKIPPQQSGAISGTVMGDENPVPEFATPALLFLTTAAATMALIIAKKRTKAKTP